MMFRACNSALGRSCLQRSRLTSRRLLSDNIAEEVLGKAATTEIKEGPVCFKPHASDFPDLATYKTLFDERAPLYEKRVGGYEALDEKVLKQYFPEGLAGEMKSEFEFSRSTSWMIRQQTKIVCGIVDELEQTINGFEIKEPSLLKSTHSPRQKLNIPGLTDRPALRNSILNAQHFGTEIFDPKGNCDKLKSPLLQPDSQVSNATLENISKIKSTMNDQIPNKVLLAGPEGSGKSTVLNQAVLYARSRNWIVMYVPEGWKQVQDGPYIQPVVLDNGKELFDNPFMSTVLLRGFHKSHKDDLKNKKIQNLEALKKYQSTLDLFTSDRQRALAVPGREKWNFIDFRKTINEGEEFDSEDALDAEFLKNHTFSDYKIETLEDLLLLGIAFRKFAGLVVIDLVEELKMIKDQPFMIAIDQINSWEVKTSFAFDNKSVHSKQLCVPYALKFLSTIKSETESFQFNNGLCLGASSGYYTEGRSINYDNYRRSIPFLLTVPNYNQIEYLSSIVHYMGANRIQDDLDINHLLSFRVISDSNPKLIRTEQIHYFVPLDMLKFGSDIIDFDDSRTQSGILKRIDDIDEKSSENTEASTEIAKGKGKAAAKGKGIQQKPKYDKKAAMKAKKDKKNNKKK